MRFEISILILVIGLLVATGAHAADSDSDGCVNETNPDLRISYCTRVIQSGQYLGADAAPAFYDRGLAYNKVGQYDLAIADFDEAIHLNPNLAAVFDDRGVAYYNKGEYDHAIADYNEAIRLNPDFAD